MNSTMNLRALAYLWRSIYWNESEHFLSSVTHKREERDRPYNAHVPMGEGGRWVKKGQKTGCALYGRPQWLPPHMHFPTFFPSFSTCSTVLLEFPNHPLHWSIPIYPHLWALGLFFFQCNSTSLSFKPNERIPWWEQNKFLFSPTLLMNDGALTGEQVVDAVTRGLRAGEAQYPTVKVWSPNSSVLTS